MIHNARVVLANQNNLPAIVSIYNQAIRSKKSTAHTTEFTTDERVEWFNKFNASSYPIYVVEVDKQVVAYGSLSPYREGRAALKMVAEISFYVDDAHHQKGIGSLLVTYMIEDCKRLNIKSLLAILLDVNQGSIKLLERFGFKQWGLLPLHSDFDGKRYSHLYYGLNVE